MESDGLTVWEKIMIYLELSTEGEFDEEADLLNDALEAHNAEVERLSMALAEGFRALKNWEDGHLDPNRKMRDSIFPEVKRLGQWMDKVAALEAALGPRP